MTRVVNVLRRPCTGPAVWAGPADSDEWVLRLSPAQIDGLKVALRAVRTRGLPLLKTTADDFPLPTLAGELERIADILENGRGFVLVKRIPVERYSLAEAGAIFWGVGRHLGVPVSQNASGHMLGHSRDTGRSLADPGTRGYQTRARLPFHTDGSDALGLLYLRAARAGAQTSVVSSAAVYNAVWHGAVAGHRQGRDLPPDFWGDPQSTGGGPDRGGVAPRDVIATQNSVGLGAWRHQ
ncbi:TauD/TfdA family dioxygenase [Streptomyces sp. NPDC087532]|uniref:TauD/TfdA family dioxygenase n=1 Tax=unclassified Streptomyces TaxID=2593676 RepID=UPI00381D6323